MNVTLRQLRVFAATARHGSVSLAGKELFLSQSAASAALAELEKQLGELLFDRRGKRLLLNERGRMLQPRALEVLARVEEMEALFAPGAPLAGNLKVGTSSTVGNYLMPALLGRFVAAHPQVRLTLEVGNSEKIVRRVLDFEADIGFIEGFCHHPEIEAVSWQRDRLAVCAAPDHPLARGGAPAPADLEKARWILRERGSGTREVFEAAASGRLQRLEVFLELGHTEAIKRAVEAGLGIGCLSRLALAPSLQSGTLVVLETPWLDLDRHFYLLLHREKYRTGVLQAFIDFCG